MERIGIEEYGEPTGALLLDRFAPPLELLDEGLWQDLPPAKPAPCPALSARSERTMAQMPRRRYRLLRGMVSHLHCDGPRTLAELGWEGYADVPVMVLDGADLGLIENPRARRESTRIARLALHLGLVRLLPSGRYAASDSAGRWLEEMGRRDEARWDRNRVREESQRRSGGRNWALCSAIDLLQEVLLNGAVVQLGHRPRLIRPHWSRPVYRWLIRWAIQAGLLSKAPGGGALTLHRDAAQRRYDELAMRTTLACVAGYDDEEVVERGMDLALAQELVAPEGNRLVVTPAGHAWLRQAL